MTRTNRKSVLPAIGLLGALALASAAPSIAQESGVPNEQMRAEIERQLGLLPSRDAPARVSVQIVDGKYVISGTVDGTGNATDARDAIKRIEGLDMSLVEERLVRQ